MKSEAEHKYTSTGIKFWCHPMQMQSFRSGGCHTVVSTHVSPEGACNLKCPFCSVSNRGTKHTRIDLDVIKDYIIKLGTVGLRAVIVTGGGEPVLYPQFNELIRWLKVGQELSVALITNGTLSHLIDDDVWKCFSWVRVSINTFNNWEEKIWLPSDKLDISCVVGASFVSADSVYGSQVVEPIVLLGEVVRVASKIQAEYVRVLPDCLITGTELEYQHKMIDSLLQALGDKRFFRQHKYHRAPLVRKCYQAYFRPYLSEELHKVTGVPGSVYPCDSVVLNNHVARFEGKYQLCAPADILDFLSGKIGQGFRPSEDCHDCVFTRNVEMLALWKAEGVGRFEEFKDGLEHEEFV